MTIENTDAHAVKKEIPFSVGDVVMVLRDYGDMEGEEAGIIDSVEPGGRVFVNYGGVVSLLHEGDQVREAPRDIRDALELRLKQNEAELRGRIFQKTGHLREVLEEYHENLTFFGWLKSSVKTFLNKKGRE